MDPGPAARGAGIGDIVMSSAGNGRTPSLVAVLSGIALGWLIGAVVTLLEPEFSVGQPTAPLVLAGCLLASSVGPGLPRRMVWLLTRSPSAPNRTAPQTHSPRDVQLLWVILATVSTLAGLATTAIPLSCVAGRSVYGSAMEHFFWMPLPHGILIVLITSIMTVLPLSLIACGLTCISQLTRSDGLWSQAALPWVLLGAGTGLAVSSGLAQSVLPPNASIALAALPLFAVAIVAVGQSKNDGNENLAHILPLQSNPTIGTTPAWSRSVATATAAIQAMAVVVWIQLLSSVQHVDLSATSLTTLALWTTAAGIAMASHRSSGEALGRMPGLVGVLAGTCHLAAAAIVTGRLDSLFGGVRADDSLLFDSLIIPAVALFVGGWTIGLMHRIALSPTTDGPNCSVGRNAMGAAILGRCATWPAVAIILMAVANSVGNDPGTLLALAGPAVAAGAIVFTRRSRPSAMP